MQAACETAMHGGLDTVDCLLDHLSSSCPDMAAAEVAGSTARSDQQEDACRPLLAAGAQDTAGVRAALQQHFPDVPVWDDQLHQQNLCTHRSSHCGNAAQMSKSTATSTR